jgi:hypothetical protein
LTEDVLISFDIAFLRLFLSLLNKMILGIFLASLGNTIILQRELREMSQQQEVFS